MTAMVAPDHSAAAQLFIDALLKPGDETRAALFEHLADDVTLMGMLGVAEGKEAILPHLQSVPELAPDTDIATYFGQLAWSQPMPATEFAQPGERDSKSPGLEGDFDVVMQADRPPRHFAFSFAFDDNENIALIAIGAWIDETEKLPVLIPDDLKEKIATASDHWRQVVVSYATGDGRMHIGLRGSAYVYSDDQLAFWARDDGGSLARALADNSDQEIAMLYFDPDRGAYFEFYGRARIEASDEIRNQVFETMHEWEKNHSWDRKGLAVIIDIDRVRGTAMDGFIEMERRP